MTLTTMNRGNQNMEVATVGSSYAVGGPHGSASAAGTGERGILVTEQQKGIVTFPVGDGRIAVTEVEETAAVAVHEDERGNLQFVQAFVKQVNLLGVFGVQAIRNTPTVQQGAAHVEEEEVCGTCCRGCGASFMFLIAIAYVVMVILGILRFNACSDQRLAIYTIVQGLAVTLNAVSLGIMFSRAKVIRPHLITGIIIYIFNVVFGGIGYWWMRTCDDVQLGQTAFWYTMIIHAPVTLLLSYCFCVCFCKSYCKPCCDDS